MSGVCIISSSVARWHRSHQRMHKARDGHKLSAKWQCGFVPGQLFTDTSSFSPILRLSIHLSLSLPLSYFSYAIEEKSREIGRAKEDFGCQVWAKCSWHWKQNLECGFSIEPIMKAEIEIHQESRVNVKTPTPGPGRPWSPAFTIHMLCALGQVTQPIWTLVAFDIELELNHQHKYQTKESGTKKTLSKH